MKAFSASNRSNLSSASGMRSRKIRYAADARSRTNVLLVKDEVGQAKPFTRPLPHMEFSYGQPVIHDDEHAPEGKNSQQLHSVLIWLNLSFVC